VATVAHWRKAVLTKSPDASVGLYLQAVRYGDPGPADTYRRTLRRVGFPE
jgi:hypothetical protein